MHTGIYIHTIAAIDEVLDRSFLWCRCFTNCTRGLPYSNLKILLLPIIFEKECSSLLFNMYKNTDHYVMLTDLQFYSQWIIYETWHHTALWVFAFVYLLVGNLGNFIVNFVNQHSWLLYCGWVLCYGYVLLSNIKSFAFEVFLSVCWYHDLQLMLMY